MNPKRGLFYLFLAVLLLAFNVWADSGRETKMRSPMQVDIMYNTEGYAYSMRDINDVIRFQVLPDGSIVKYDSSGNTEFFVPDNRTVYITNVSQLSSWGDTTGASYFRCSPGKTYFVDPYAIANGNAAGAPSGTSAMIAFAGVSAILPDASVYEGPHNDVTIGIITTGATGHVHAMAGVTTVNVWPYIGTGATTYTNTYDLDPQNMLTIYTNTVGAVSTYQVAAGASYWELNKYGESAVFGLENAAVSAYPKQRNIIIDNQ